MTESVDGAVELRSRCACGGLPRRRDAAMQVIDADAGPDQPEWKPEDAR